MPFDLLTLSQTAAATVMAAMATDGWAQIRDVFASVLGRGEPYRSQAVAADLDHQRDAVLAAPAASQQTVAGALEGELAHRLHAQLRYDRALAADLAELVRQVRPLVAAAVGAVPGPVGGDGTHPGVLPTDARRPAVSRQSADRRSADRRDRVVRMLTVTAGLVFAVGFTVWFLALMSGVVGSGSAPGSDQLTQPPGPDVAGVPLGAWGFGTAALGVALGGVAAFLNVHARLRRGDATGQG
jgi:hypothetical protein